MMFRLLVAIAAVIAIAGSLSGGTTTLLRSVVGRRMLQGGGMLNGNLVQEATCDLTGSGAVEWKRLTWNQDQLRVKIADVDSDWPEARGEESALS